MLAISKFRSPYSKTHSRIVGDSLAWQRAFDRLFETPLPRRSYRPASFKSVALDVYEADDNVVIEATLPGLAPDQVDISVEKKVLTIKGEVKNDGDDEDENGNGSKYYVRERFYGAFERRIRLPDDVDTDAAEAKFENGLLTVTLPKAETAKRHQISVNAS